MKIKHSLIFTFIAFLIMFSRPLFCQDDNKIIDEVVAIVGSNIIKHSDIETQYVQYQSQGMNLVPSEKCRILEDFLFQKLLLNKAQVDSIEISDEQVEAELDRRIRYFVSQLGSEAKLEEFYNKSINEIKSEFKTSIHEQILSQKTQETITGGIKISPAEIIQYYNKIPKDSLPLINSEYEIGHILVEPPISEQEIMRAKSRLNELRDRIIREDNFATMAVLYSEDNGSASQGGELGFHMRGELFPEFEVVAFSTKPGEISEVFETQAGFHILQVIKRNGDYINSRHILIQTKVSQEDLISASTELRKIATDIRSNAISFVDAALKHSDDPNKNNEGMLINQMTGTSVFEADQIDPALFFTIDKMDPGDVSDPVTFQMEDGKQAYRIVYLKSRTTPHAANLKDDYNKIQEAALNEKKANKINDWIKKATEKTYVKVNERYIQCKFDNDWSLNK